jgi:hypothetical protein
MLSGFPQRPTTNIDGNNNEIGAYIYGYRHQTSLGYWGRVPRDEKLIKLRVKRFEVSNSIGFRDFGLTSHTTKKLLPMTENAFLSSTLYQRNISGYSGSRRPSSWCGPGIIDRHVSTENYVFLFISFTFRCIMSKLCFSLSRIHERLH